MPASIAGGAQGRKRRPMSLTWNQVTAIIGAFVAAMGAFAYHIDRRFDDLYRYLDVRFNSLERRIEVIESDLKISSRNK